MAKKVEKKHEVREITGTISSVLDVFEYKDKDGQIKRLRNINVAVEENGETDYYQVTFHGVRAIAAAAGLVLNTEKREWEPIGVAGKFRLWEEGRPCEGGCIFPCDIQCQKNSIDK